MTDEQQAQIAQGSRLLWSAQTLLQTVLDALTGLHWSVFPLDLEKMPPKTGGVHPDGTPKRLSWKAYQSRLPSVQQVRDWSERYDPAIWGVITGALSGMIVLDFDGEKGRATRERLALRPHVQSGSGGHHVYFHHPGWQVPTLNSKAKKALGQRWPGLDIRADGGMAAFCGHNRHGPYLWLREPDLEPLDLLPDDLREFLGLLHAPTAAPPAPREAPVSLVRRPIDLSDHLLRKYIAEARVRGRNNAGFDLACQLRDNAYSQQEAEVLLREYAHLVPDANQKGEREAYTETEALLSVQSAYQSSARPAWTSYAPAPASRGSSRGNGNGHHSGGMSSNGRDAGDDPGRGEDNRHKYAELLAEPLVDLAFVLACLRDAEWGDSNLFAHLFARRLVYDHLEKRAAWHFYQGHAWHKDTKQFVKQLVAEVLAGVYLRASARLRLQLETAKGPTEIPADGLRERSQEEEAEQRRVEGMAQQAKALWARGIELRTSARNNNVLSLAISHPDLAVTSEIWDRDPWLLGTRKGVLDLRTGTLRPGNPDDYIRTVIPTPWKGLDAPAPRFEQYLQEIFADRSEQERADLIGFLQRALGYGLTGHVNEHIFLMLYGIEGRNGKDTLMSLLAYVLGEAVGAVSNDVIIASGRLSAPGSAKPHLCSLQGKRIAWASETEKGARFDIAQVKFLTGGGTIPARHLYGEDFTFDPSHLLILLTNNKPHADADDKAFWDRLCPITFNLRFIDRPEAKNERQKDIHLGKTLEAEASGILAWLVRGCLAWQREGLQIPVCVIRERKAYQGEEDTLGQFLDECCVRLSHAKVKAKQLYTRYAQWCAENRLQALTGTAFGLSLGKRYKRDREKNGWHYYGIGLLETDERMVNSGEQLPKNHSPVHETASSADVEHISPSMAVNSCKNYSPSHEVASSANAGPLENGSGEQYERFCNKNLLKSESDDSLFRENPPEKIVFRETVHTVHQKPNNTAKDDAIIPPEKPAKGEEREATQTVHQPFTHEGQKNGDEAAPGADWQADEQLEGNHSPPFTRQQCATRWEKLRKVRHEAAGVQFEAGCWWCERCTNQRALLEIGERLGYPALSLSYQGRASRLKAGREEWLRLACDGGYALVEHARTVAQQQEAQTSLTGQGEGEVSS